MPKFQKKSVIDATEAAQVAEAKLAAAALVATPVFEQPEVPELEALPSMFGTSAEDEILAGSEEDRLIGQTDEAPEMNDRQMQALQIQALVDLASSVKGIVANQERTKQLSYSEIKPNSPWNPTGRRDMLRLKGEFYQNGQPVNPLMMNEEERLLANQLKPGRYINRTVEVTRYADGGLNISWPSKRVDQRIMFYGQFRTFPELCHAIMAERSEKEAKRKRGDFDSDEAL